MVVLPDTQRYTLSDTVAQVWYNQTQWIADNAEDLGIELVLHTGDITENNIPSQWQIAKQAMSKLDGVVPYMMAYGNHDIWPLPEDKSQLIFNNYFSLSDNPLNSFVTERVLGDLSNTYGQFTASDGRELALVNLEFKPQEDPAIYAWANSVFAANPDSTGITFTHHNLNEDPDNVTATGEPVTIRHGRGILNWNKLNSLHENIEFVFSGHALDKEDIDAYGPLTTARLDEQGVHGNTVHEITFNSQQQPNAGNGYLRILEFLDDGTTVQVRTYSPFLDVWLTNNRNEFQVEVSPIFSADFNQDDQVDSIDLQAWSDGFGVDGGGDADDDTDTDGRDFLVWQRQLSASSASFASSSDSVPEPSALVLFIAGLIAMSSLRLN